MKTSTIIASLMLLIMLLGGCATYGYDGARYPDQRYPDRRTDGRYPDRRAPRASHYYNRVDRDASHYVRTLDRNLRLNRRQQQQIDRLLADRAYRLLDRTRANDHDRVYPFPRRFDRRQSGAVESWWRDVDRDVERLLDRRQRDEYRYLTRNYDGYGKNRGSYRGKGKKKGHYKKGKHDD